MDPNPFDLIGSLLGSLQGEHEQASDQDSDATLCSDLEDRFVPPGNPFQPHIHFPLGDLSSNPFERDDDILETSAEEPVANFGLDDRFAMYYEDDDEDENYDVAVDSDEYETDETNERGQYSSATEHEHKDIKFQLGRLKLSSTKNYQHKIKSYFSSDYDFDAEDELIVLNAFGSPKHENLVPFKLSNASLFAEWYYAFKNAYARTSPLNHAYCTVDKSTLYSFLFGPTSITKTWLVAKLEETFSDTFKKCLSVRLRREYADRNLSREYVESTLVHELAKKAKKGAIKNRHAALYKNATTGDFEAYMCFLKAHEFPNEDIYDLIATAFVRNIDDDKDLRYYDLMREKYRDSRGSVFDRVGDLAHSLSSESLLKPPTISSYSVASVLKRKPQYKKLYKNNLRGGAKKQEKNSKGNASQKKTKGKTSHRSQKSQ